MTFTSTFLAVLAGIALWQLVIFIGYIFGLEDNDNFLNFIACFFMIPLLVLIPVIGNLTLFAFSKLFVKADFYCLDERIISVFAAKKDRKLFETNTENKYYVTFEEVKFKSLPMKQDIYHKGQKFCYDVKVDKYLKKRD